MKNVLVLCTGNSCRSILAEGLINHLGDSKFSAQSAGSAPTGTVHPKSLETLERHSIAITNPRSKSWGEFADTEFDYIITVCDQAANEACPLPMHNSFKLHWSTPDPAKAEGSGGEIDAAFESAFQLLKSRIENELLF